MVLGIAKKMGVIKVTMQDVTYGKLAERGVWRYSDIMGFYSIQLRMLRPLAWTVTWPFVSATGKLVTISALLVILVSMLFSYAGSPTA